MVTYATVVLQCKCLCNFLYHCSIFTFEHLVMSFSCICFIYRKVSPTIQHSLKTQKTIIWGKPAVKTWKLISQSYFKSCAMAQAVRCCPLAGKPRFLPRPVYVGFMIEKVAMGQVFLLILKLYPASYHSINSPYPHSFTWHQCYIILAVDSVVK